MEPDLPDPLAKDNRPGRFDGIPGLVWYANVRKVRGNELALGMWLDSLDHRGARSIAGIWYGDSPEPSRSLFVGEERLTVMFFGGDTEVVRADVEYDVVKPDSQVTPDGSPLS